MVPSTRARGERSAKRELEELQRKYPLPRGCQLKQTFLQRVQVGELELFSVGLVASAPGRLTVIGAAADSQSFPVMRAFFELVERISIMLARSSTAPFDVSDSQGIVRRRLAAACLFPVDPKPERSRIALSNGVALHDTWELAARGALCELVERDRVLRSFDHGPAPIPVTVRDRKLARALRGEYRVQAFAFEPRAQALQHRVAGLFLFPRQVEHPLIYGFGAALNAEAALEKATSEAVQRLAFLWGEALPSQLPEVSATPDYHQEYYLYPPQHDVLRRWLSGKRSTVRNRSLRLFDGEVVSFVDLTPRALKGKLFVVRAISTRARVLRFGAGRRAADDVHPVV